MPPPMTGIKPPPSVSTLWDRHAGADVFVCGFGASLLDFDWSRLDGRVTVALNDAITKHPTATYHLYADGRLYRFYWSVPYGAETTVVMQPCGTRRVVAALGWAHWPKLRLFARGKEVSELAAITREDDRLWTLTTVATAGIMLAWKLGAARVYLLGVDGYIMPGSAYYADGALCPAGWAMDHLMPNGYGVQERHVAWNADMLALRTYFDGQARAGVPVPEVVNLNPLSSIDVWPKAHMEKFL